MKVKSRFVLFYSLTVWVWNQFEVNFSLIVCCIWLSAMQLSCLSQNVYTIRHHLLSLNYRGSGPRLTIAWFCENECLTSPCKSFNHVGNTCDSQQNSRNVMQFVLLSSFWRLWPLVSIKIKIDLNVSSLCAMWWIKMASEHLSGEAMRLSGCVEGHAAYKGDWESCIMTLLIYD